MYSVQTYLLDLNNYENDASNALSALYSLKDVINADDGHLGLNLEVLFNDTNGLLCFLKLLRNEPQINEELTKCCFELLGNILASFPAAVKRYIPAIFDFCDKSIFHSKNKILRDQPYILLIDLIKSSDIDYFQDNLDCLRNFYINLLFNKTGNTISSTEKRYVFSLIGKICEYYPEVIDVPIKLFRLLDEKLKNQLKFNEVQSSSFHSIEVQGYLECLISILKNFADVLNEEEINKFYMIIKNCFTLTVDRRTFIRAVIEVIQHHFTLFSENIYNDYQVWHIRLENYLLSDNKEDSVVAFRALNVFYPGIAKVLETKSNTDGKKTLKYFISAVQNGMQQRHRKQVILAMGNFGFFANVCKKFNLITELHEMFKLTAEIAHKYCSGQIETEIEVHHLSSLLVSVAEISKNLYSESVDKDEFRIIEKLSIFIVVSYPKVPPKFQFYVKNDLIKTIVTVSLITETVLDSYLEELMFIGLIKTCSCLLESDIEILKEFNNFNENELTSSKDYIDLWRSVCNMRQAVPVIESIPEKLKIEVLNKGYLSCKVFDKFMQTQMKIIRKLDFTILENDESVLYNGENHLKPNAEGDFFIFMNLAQVFCSVVSNCDISEFEKWIPELITFFINLIPSCPIKSGFYDLLTVIFQKAGSEFYEKCQEIDMYPIHMFLAQTLLHIRELKGNDLLSCLWMVMHAPDSAIFEIAPHIYSLFQIIFTLGLEDLSLAQKGLMVLRNWHDKLDSENFKPILKAVVPLLNPYMQNKIFTGDSESLTKFEEKLLMPVASNSKNKILQKFRKPHYKSTNAELRRFQKQVVNFFGEINSEFCECIYKQENFVTNEYTEVLRFELPFTDMKVKIYLDKIFPRVMDLASYSSDLKTRVAACEVLHSITVVFLGNSHFLEMKYPESAENLFKSLLSCIFKLGSDNNDVIKQLFHPLSFQLTNYYSSKAQSKSKTTDVLLGILFDGVSNESNVSLRHFSADLIHDFTLWSFKQQQISHVQSVIRRIRLFCIQPCAFKKLGGAIAFNSIYRQLREEIFILKTYWIQLLYYFVQNLWLSDENDCNINEVSKAIDNLKRVLCEKNDIFHQEVNEKHRLPKPLQNGTLKDVIRWLFSQCLSQNKICRNKCMELIVELSEKLHDCGSLKAYFTVIMTNKDEVLETFLKEISFKIDDLKSNATYYNDVWNEVDQNEILKTLFSILKSLLSSLHCIYWLMTEAAVSFEENINSRFWSSLKCFTVQILPFNLKSFLDNLFPGIRKQYLSTNIDVTFESLKQDIFLEFLKILSRSGPEFQYIIGEETWQRNMWSVYISYLFNSSHLCRNYVKREMIYEILASVLKELKVQPNVDTIYSQIKANVDFNSLENSLEKLIDQQYILASDQHYVTILIILQKTDILLEILPEMVETKKKLTKEIFEIVNDHGQARTFSPTVLSYLENVLTFSIKNLEVLFVCELIFNTFEIVLKSTTCTTISHGQHFFRLFKKPIIEFLSQHQAEFVFYCLRLDQLSKQKLQTITDCFKFCAESKLSIMLDDLLVGIFQIWSLLITWSFQCNCNSYIFDLISVIASSKPINLKKKDCLKMLLWLLNRLIDEKESVTHKMEILKLLPSLITGTDENNLILREKLQLFQGQYFGESATLKLNDTESTNVYNVLLYLFHDSENKVVFEVVVSIAIMEYKEEFYENISNALKITLNKISVEVQLDFLNFIFELFEKTNNAEHQMKYVQIFLIPMLYCVDSETLQLFFNSSKIEYILSMMDVNFQIKETERAVISMKTGAVLITQVYCDMECSHINQFVSPNDSRNVDIRKKIFNILKTPITLNDASNQSALRKLKCYSYNTLIKILRKWSKNLDTYANLFKEHLWSHIIDNNEEIKLTMFIDEVSDRKKTLIKNRTELKSTSAKGSICTIPTQYLSTSSLAPEIVKFDMSEWTISSDNNNIKTIDSNIYNFDLEADKLNNHECMTEICELINFIVKSGIIPTSNNTFNLNSELPEWMKHLRQSLQIARKKGREQRNVVLFILKLIYNCESSFRPYANVWIDLIIDCLLFLNEVNYLVSDVIIMLLKWSEISVPKDRLRGSLLLDLLIRSISFDNTTVRNYQLELINSVIQIWHQFIDIPFEKLRIFKTDGTCELQVKITGAKRWLLCNKLPFREEESFNYVEILLYVLDGNNDVLKRPYKVMIFEILALILRITKNKEQFNGLHSVVSNKLIEKLKTLKENNVKTKKYEFFSYLQHAVIYFPRILQSFSTYILQTFVTLERPIRTKCLQMIATDISQMPDDAFSQLMNAQFISCLRGNDHELLKSALVVVKLYVNVLKEYELNSLFPEIIRLSSHVNTECRSLTYDITDAIYMMYRNKTEVEFSEIISQCKSILLNGLLDPETALQKKIFTSWIRRCHLSTAVADRFLELTKHMYSIQNESRFVNYTVDYLLDACASTPDFKSKVFDNPLEKCVFKDYQAVLSFRQKQSVAPMFLNSFSKKLTMSLQNSHSTNMSLVIRGTPRKLIFQPTLDTQSSDENVYEEFANQWVPDSGNRLSNSVFNENVKAAGCEPETTNSYLQKLQRRLLPNTAKESEYYAARNVKLREQKVIFQAKRAERLEKQVQFYRTYRIGDFPDIEISRAAVIVPLQILSKRDPVISKLLFVSIFDGILCGMSDTKRYLRSVNDIFSDILEVTSQHCSILIETLFEIAFHYSNDIHFSSERIVFSAHSSGLLSLGALLIENLLSSKLNLEHFPHVSKKLKVDDFFPDNMWMQLVELYKALDKNDVVNGILKEQMEDNISEQLKNGIEYEQARHWIKAFKIYDVEVNRISDLPRPYDEHFILEAFCKSAANLCKWDKISSVIKNKFRDINNMWDDTWDVEHTLPWLFCSEAYQCVQGDYPYDKLNVVKLWLKDEEKNVILTNLMAEPLSMMLLLSGDNYEAKYIVDQCLESIIDDWGYSTLSLEKFLRLQTLSEINAMLAVFEVSEKYISPNSVKQILKMWENNQPQNDSLVWWDKRTVYRQRFSHKYADLLDEEDYRREECLKKIDIFNVNSDLRMIEVALEQHNTSVANKYIPEAFDKIDKMKNSDLLNVKSQFKLNYSKVLFMKGCQTDVSKKMKKFKKSLNILNNEKSELSESYRYPYLIHLNNLLSTIIAENHLFCADNGDLSDLVHSLKPILKKLDIDNESVFCEIHDSIIKNYHEAATLAESNNIYSRIEISTPYLALGKYCKEKMTDDPTLEDCFVRSILRAIKYDSKEAQLLFPTLLQTENLTKNTLKSVFISESETIEEWKFLIWINQLLAYSDTNIVHVIDKLILRIIKKYPKAFQFSFLSSDLEALEFKNGAGRNLHQELRGILGRSNSPSCLIKALACVRVPECFFLYYMEKFSKILKKDASIWLRELNLLKNEIYFNNIQFKGNVFLENKLWKRLDELFDKVQADPDLGTISSINNELEECRKDCQKYLLRSDCNSSYTSKRLGDYSPWLSNFCEKGITDIEVPGQYDGFCPPNPEQHVKIYDFESMVRIQSSKQKPIKITITGSDAKKYSYLIKFGEDMRQDQRIQQIFTIMNKCTESNSSYMPENYYVTTYNVFPLTRFFGIIQWLENTTSLGEFMSYGLSENNKIIRKQKRIELRETYLDNLRSTELHMNKWFEAAVKNYRTIVLRFKNYCKEFPEDMLKNALLNLCNTPVIYWNLRNQFMISYSTMCMYGWILGIGDRHLENILVCLKTGRCIGIDFGYAFGTGVEHLSIPELIPFRMTPHIKSLMAPFYVTGLIRETMINVLRIIHKSEYILYATMQIFIIEPSVNWLEAARKRMLEQNELLDFDLQWYPTKKLQMVKRKLDTVSPIKIMVEQVRENKEISPEYSEACVNLLMRENSRRINLPEYMSPSDQVECLLDLATDENILGTSWVGLETYI